MEDGRGSTEEVAGSWTASFTLVATPSTSTVSLSVAFLHGLKIVYILNVAAIVISVEQIGRLRT